MGGGRSFFEEIHPQAAFKRLNSSCKDRCNQCGQFACLLQPLRSAYDQHGLDSHLEAVYNIDETDVPTIVGLATEHASA